MRHVCPAEADASESGSQCPVLQVRKMVPLKGNYSSGVKSALQLLATPSRREWCGEFSLSQAQAGKQSLRLCVDKLW